MEAVDEAAPLSLYFRTGKGRKALGRKGFKGLNHLARMRLYFMNFFGAIALRGKVSWTGKRVVSNFMPTLRISPLYGGGLDVDRVRVIWYHS